jgi:hypothetical protein
MMHPRSVSCVATFLLLLAPACPDPDPVPIDTQGDDETGDYDGDGDTCDGDGDGEGDGDGDPDGDMDGSPANEDCNDADPHNYPGNDEVCDEQDNDCDMDVDEDAVDAMTYYPDMDMDGYGAGMGFTSCEVPPDAVTEDGDCNDNDPDAYPDSNNVCPLGQTCKAIFDSGAGMDDGVYLIDYDGVDVGQNPFDIWCDMTNGGWTVGLVINSVNEGTYVGNFAANFSDVHLLDADPAEASSPIATAVQAWLDLNVFPYDELTLASHSDGANTFVSQTIDRADLRIEFGQNGYLLWNDDNGYYWCGGASTYTDGGQGQINQPMGAPADCKNHGLLGSGWDFSVGPVANMGLTLCGGNSTTPWMHRNYDNGITFYPNPGAAYVIWVR